MLEIIIKLILALAVGSLIGAEREFREKSAGLRTITLVCLGSTLFTIFSSIFDPVRGDPSRVAASIVTGIGFLGAGVILREKKHVWGLTTAAIIWLVAALGMGIGIGQYFTVGLATAATLTILWGFPKLDYLSKARDTYTYEIVAPSEKAKFDALVGKFKEVGLKITSQIVERKGNKIIVTWQAYGNPESHARLMQEFLADTEIDEFRIL